jgi:hypothetical protein
MQIIIEEWQQKWNEGETGRFRYSVQKDLRPRPRVHLIRKQDVLLTRLRLGTARLAQWRHQVLGEASPLCEACEFENETLEHLIIDCTAWRRQRAQMWRELNIKGVNRTLENLLHNGNTIHGTVKQRVTAVSNFLKETKRREFICLVY